VKKSSGSPEPDGAGRAGTFDQNSNAMSARTATDLDFTTLVRLGGPDPDTGGALSLLRRSSSDGTGVRIESRSTRRIHPRDKR
jgi:levanbiose-producing levanase